MTQLARASLVSALISGRALTIIGSQEDSCCKDSRTFSCVGI
jgi:hypothetical protein